MTKQDFSTRLIDYLEALIEERHVSNAAARLQINQPTMSLALKRLRDLLNDPILVKTQNGYIATKTAMDVYEELRGARNVINRALENRQIFEPGRADIEYTLAAGESITLHLVPKVIERVAAINRHIRFRCLHLDLASVKTHLEDGRIDLMLSYTNHAPPALRHTLLSKDTIVGVKSRRNTRLGDVVTLDDYLAQDHVCHGVTQGMGSVVEQGIDQFMTANGLTRRKVCTVHSSVIVASTIGRSSNMVAALPRSVAHLLADSLGLALFELPFELEPIAIGMYWHERCHHQGSHRWLRQIFKEEAQAGPWDERSGQVA